MAHDGRIFSKSTLVPAEGVFDRLAEQPREGIAKNRLATMLKNRMASCSIG